MFMIIMLFATDITESMLQNWTRDVLFTVVPRVQEKEQIQ